MISQLAGAPVPNQPTSLQVLQFPTNQPTNLQVLQVPRILTVLAIEEEEEGEAEGSPAAGMKALMASSSDGAAGPSATHARRRSFAFWEVQSGSGV